MNSEMNCEAGAAECCTKKPPTNLESQSGLTGIGNTDGDFQTDSQCLKSEEEWSKKFLEWDAGNRTKAAEFVSKKKRKSNRSSLPWSERKQEYMRAYNEARKEKMREYRKERYAIKGDEIRAKQRVQASLNRDKLNAQTAAWRKANPERLKETQRIYYQKAGKARRQHRRDTIPQVRIDSCCRSRINTALKHAGVWKSENTQTLIGCSLEAYKSHIEKQFQPWMTWENWGTEWEIDHIIPICKFDLTILEERLKAFHYSNCQPLRKVLNRIKNDKMPHELDERFVVRIGSQK